MRLEHEVRKRSTVEQHFTHGDWRIVKIYVHGELSEIKVNSIGNA